MEANNTNPDQITSKGAVRSGSIFLALNAISEHEQTSGTDDKSRYRQTKG